MLSAVLEEPDLPLIPIALAVPLLSPLTLFFAAAGLLQSLGMDGSTEADDAEVDADDEVEEEEGLKEVPLDVVLLALAELTPFEVIVMPKRFLTLEGLVGTLVVMVFLGLGSVVGRDCLIGEGLDSDEVVEDTGERREVGSPKSSSASVKWMW